MQFSSIEFTSNYFAHKKVSDDLKFHNHMLEPESELINHYYKEFIKTITMIENIKFKKIRDRINQIKNASFLESNADIELVVQVMKKYGFAVRYIIKEMLGGENLF